MGFFSNLIARTETVEHEIVNEVDAVVVEPFIHSINRLIEPEVKRAFESAHSAAMAANAEVNFRKAKLAAALAAARDLHKSAVDAAAAAQEAAEADVIKYKAAVVAHTADMNTQAGQIIVKAPPVENQTVGNVEATLGAAGSLTKN